MSLSTSKFIKDPGATLDYVFDFTLWLDEGDTIEGFGPDITVTDGELSIASDSISEDGTKGIVWLAGGTVGYDYQITGGIVTAGGRSDERTIHILCRDK